jgi:ATP-dependent Clp protease ATP-binding subunit ClpA
MGLFRKKGAFNDTFPQVWEVALELASGFGNALVEPIHLLAGTLVADEDCARFTNQISITFDSISTFIENNVPQQSLSSRPQLSASAKDAMLGAAKIARSLGSETATSMHMLMGIFGFSDSLVNLYLSSEIGISPEKAKYLVSQWIDGSSDIDSAKLNFESFRVSNAEFTPDLEVRSFVENVQKFGSLRENDLLTEQEFIDLKQKLIQNLKEKFELLR